jgi:Rad3-related DNA helicase
VVLDSRVLSTRYGRAFLEALPVSHRTFQTQPDMIHTIRTWFDEKADGGNGKAK